MRIQVTREFAGKLTNERRIYPGVYALDAEELFGVGQYLLDNGFAVVADSESYSVDPDSDGITHAEWNVGYTSVQPDDAVDDDAVDDEPVDYSIWTVSALKEECEARGIDIMTLEGSGANGNLLKEDLVLVLAGDDADDAEEE